MIKFISHIVAGSTILFKWRTFLDALVVWAIELCLASEKVSIEHRLRDSEFMSGLTSSKSILYFLRFFFRSEGGVSGGTSPLDIAVINSIRFRWTICACSMIFLRGVLRYNRFTIWERISVHSSSSVYIKSKCMRTSGVIILCYHFELNLSKYKPIYQDYPIDLNMKLLHNSSHLVYKVWSKIFA